MMLVLVLLNVLQPFCPELPQALVTMSYSLSGAQTLPIPKKDLKYDRTGMESVVYCCESNKRPLFLTWLGGGDNIR